MASLLSLVAILLLVKSAAFFISGAFDGCMMSISDFLSFFSEIAGSIAIVLRAIRIGVIVISLLGLLVVVIFLFLVGVGLEVVRMQRLIAF